MLIVLGLGALVLPPVALWVGVRADDRLDEARDKQRELILGALGALNAETGVRGYLLTAREEFREPYDIGLRQVDASSTRLDELVDDPEASAELDELQASFAEWRTQYGEPALSAVRSGDLSSPRSLASLDQGDALFDQVRADFDRLLVRLAEDVSSAEDAQDRARLLQFALMVVAAICLAGFIATLAHVVASRRRSQEALGRTREELAEERERSRLRKEALAAASHDLRNPLAGLLLSTQILEEEASETGNDELGMMASEMVTSARRAAGMVDELLDYTRLEAGGGELEAELVNPQALVTRALGDIRLSRNDATVALEAPPGGRAKVKGDFSRLSMVVRNLLENAYRYGTPPIRVRITNGGPRVEIHVEDSGSGVPEAEHEAVFEQYRRGTTARGRDGSGIGLYISKGIVELHGGSMRIEQSPLGGADFVVALPTA
jgi:signal transduction histidine kinase